MATLTCLPGQLRAAEQTQVLTLQPGWNAIWLEVEPQDSDGLPLRPEVAFSAAPSVDVVARFLPRNAGVEFLADPNQTSLGSDFWLKWARNAIAAKNTLSAIRGNTAYLVHNASNATVSPTLTGEVKFHQYSWTTDSFNLFGIPTESSATAPTIGEFFGPSPAHPLNQVFKLSNGSWVAASSAERIQKGAAYWVYCKGGSSYQGPLPLVFPESSGGVLGLGELRTTAEVTAGNLANAPASLTLQRILNGGVTLREQSSGSGIVDFAITTDASGVGTIPAQGSASIRLEASRSWTVAPAMRENLYKARAQLSSGSSYFQYLPVSAAINLDPAAGSGSGGVTPGLWVGDVVLSTATSLVEGKSGSSTLAGPREEPVSSALTYRLILHVDAAGQVRLLNQATVMQKQRASEELPQEQVVVIDNSAIPSLVGIETRGGKLVGQRFDTAAYDLPRTTVPPTSADANVDFDPSTLAQTYLASLDLAGSLAPGGVVTTATGSLVLDPWHRTNPYKHVFHPEHRKGFRVTREMRLEIDLADSPTATKLAEYGKLHLAGVFEEEIRGLTKSGDVSKLRGRFHLVRVCPATELQ